MDRSFIGNSFPQNFACDPIKTNYLESMLKICADGIRVNEVTAVRHFVGHARSSSGNGFTVHRGGKKYFLSPDNWRRMTATANRGLPFNVLATGPFGRQAFFF